MTCVVDDGQAVGRLLKEKGIVASINVGRELCISPHFFNTRDDIDQLIYVLEVGL